MQVNRYSISFKGFLFYKHFYKVAEKFTSYEPENETNLAFTHLCATDIWLYKITNLTVFKQTFKSDQSTQMSKRQICLIFGFISSKFFGNFIEMFIRQKNLKID